MGIIPDLIIVNDKRIGKGLLAGRTFNPGNKILELEGGVLAREQFSAEPVSLPGVVQIAPDLFVKLDEGSPACFIKHSCDPNAGLVFKSDGHVELVAVNCILPMGEIGWDFSTTWAGRSVEIPCKCKKKPCREKIGNYETLPEPVRRRYEYLGIVAPYLAPMTVIR